MFEESNHHIPGSSLEPRFLFIQQKWDKIAYFRFISMGNYIIWQNTEAQVVIPHKGVCIKKEKLFKKTTSKFKVYELCKEVTA